MVEITRERWDALRSQPKTGWLTCEPVDASRKDCLMGVDEDGRLHLLLRIPEEPTDIPQEVQAISVRVLETDEFGLSLDLSSPSHHQGIFTTLASQVADAVIVQGREPHEAVVDCLSEFKAAFKNVTPEISPSEQIGLYGELWVLLRVIVPHFGPRGVLLWSGPDRERHDFIGDFTHIEVKATTGRESRHEISMVNQLNSAPNKNLLFASVILERSKGGSESIADKIDQIRVLLGNDSRAIDAFEKSLSDMNWHDELRQSGELLRFNLTNAFFFHVDATFSKLPSDFVMPREVVAMKYTIDVSSRPSLNAKEVVQFLAGK